MLLLTPVKAQYVYVDIPDTTLEKNGDFFDLDVNNDSILDSSVVVVTFTLGATTTSFNNSSILAKVNSFVMVYR